MVGAPANFTVETFSAGRGQVDVAVENPKGQKEPVEVRFNNDRNLTHSVSYTPKMEGPHKVTVKFAGREVPKSPYTVQVLRYTLHVHIVFISSARLKGMLVIQQKSQHPVQVYSQTETASIDQHILTFSQKTREEVYQK